MNHIRSVTSLSVPQTQITHRLMLRDGVQAGPGGGLADKGSKAAAPSADATGPVSAGLARFCRERENALGGT
jgi:hypothetical protein